MNTTATQGNINTGIIKKQFLGDRSLTEYFAAPQVTDIGEWAFAHCVNLRWAAIPARLGHIGREAFAGCDRLELIHFYETGEMADEKTHGAWTGHFRVEELTAWQYRMGRLNAIAYRYFQDTDALTAALGGTNEVWMESWDRECERYLDTPDDLGFQPFLAGGEEDYDEAEDNAAAYCHSTRLRKGKIILERLLADDIAPLLPKKGRRAFYQKRLRELTGEALELLANTEDSLRQTLEVYDAAGILTDENLRVVMDMLPVGQVELKAMLMQRTNGNLMDLFSL